MPEKTGKRADEIQPNGDNERAVLGFHTALMLYDMDRFGAIWTDDAVHEVPFHVAGPMEIVGRENIVEAYRRILANRRDLVFTINALHRTDDPNCMIVEFRGVSIVGETGDVYDQTYIGVFRLRRGEIFLLRLYTDPLVSQKVLSMGSDKEKSARS